MKKTHLYGAVAATMLLAPVTANVLAEEGETPSETTLETQNSEELTDQSTLPPKMDSDGLEGLSGEGTSTQNGVQPGEGNGTDGSKNDTNLDSTGNPDKNGIVSTDPDEGKEDLSSNQDIKMGWKSEDTLVTVDEVCNQPVLKAEDFIIPDPVTMDTTVVVLEGSEDYTMKDKFSDPIVLKDYFAKYKTVHVSLYDAKTSSSRAIDIPFEINNVDISDLNEIVRQGNNFRGSINYNCQSAVEAFNRAFGTKLAQSSSFFLECVYNQKQKSWQINDYPGYHMDNEEYLGIDTWVLHLYEPSGYESQDPLYKTEEPDLSEFNETKIVQEFLKLKDSVNVILDNHETLNIKLTPEMLNVFDYLNTKATVQVSVNIASLLANTKYGTSNYIYFINDNNNSAYVINTYANQFGYRMGYTKAQGWYLQMPNGSINSTVNLIKNSNEQLNKIEDILSSLKIHVKEKNGKFETRELDFIPNTLGITYYEHVPKEQTEWNRTTYTLYYDIYLKPYIQKIEQLTGKKYKLSDFERILHLSESAISIIEGKWHFQDPYLNETGFYRTEPLFYVEEIEEPETPIKTEATFTQDGYQVKAESKEDLTGLQIVIDEVEADNNFGLSSDYQTIGYDIHFENEEGKEVSRNGKFTVRIPIPAEFMGKEVRLFHKENKDSVATELQFKIVDGKYYEFETTSFSWFIVASQNANTKPETPSEPDPKPADPVEKPTTPADEANKPQEKPAQPATKPMANNGQTIKVVPLKAAQTKQADTKTSPDTGIAIHKTNSLFAGLLGMIGLGFLVGKRRKF